MNYVNITLNVGCHLGQTDWIFLARPLQTHCGRCVFTLEWASATTGSPENVPAEHWRSNVLLAFLAVSIIRMLQRTQKPQNATPTQRPDDQVKLVHVGFSRPEWLTRQELCKNTADGPHVHRGTVLRVSHEKFGGSVPPGGNIVCVGVSWNCEGRESGSWASHHLMAPAPRTHSVTHSPSSSSVRGSGPPDAESRPQGARTAP